MKWEKVKNKIAWFFSRIWVWILSLSYPAQDSVAKTQQQSTADSVPAQEPYTNTESASQQEGSESFSVEESKEVGLFTYLSRDSLPTGAGLLVVGFLLISFVWVNFLQPPKDFSSGEIFSIDKGATLEEIANQLEEKSIIKDSTVFKYWIKFLGKQNQIKHGDYLFQEPVNMFSVAKRLYKGLYGFEPVRVRILEGSSVRQIAEELDKVLIKFDKERFIELAQPYEGFLYPDTYYFMPNTSEKQIIKTMRENFNSRIAKLKPLIEKFGKSLEEVVIMASIVEKESWKYNDRRRIAGVLWTRLKIGMPLQVDATYVYTHNKGSSQITLKELQDKSNPYNTYVNRGLPPTPIGNPSYYAILATITPIYGGYLYYLADKHGNTYFSKTYQEHMRKRSQYINW